MDVRIGWAELDVQAQPISVQVGWAEFDTRSARIDVAVSWAEFDVRSPLAHAKAPPRPPVYSPGVSLAQYYSHTESRFTIPIDVDPDEEEDVVATILIEIATYVL